MVQFYCVVLGGVFVIFLNNATVYICHEFVAHGPSDSPVVYLGGNNVALSHSCSLNGLFLERPPFIFIFFWFLPNVKDFDEIAEEFCLLSIVAGGFLYCSEVDFCILGISLFQVMALSLSFFFFLGNRHSLF